VGSGEKINSTRFEWGAANQREKHTFFAVRIERNMHKSAITRDLLSDSTINSCIPVELPKILR
jgi:hypothetical protein